ncbi:MAG: hypothetical protein BroJett018_48260 [Chloroflexota bacterium]|nr:hypothetical protein [Chloroflexota bacterium]NOG65867.1 hypothetical protein [Chloroflexota bacterium]GIK67032.1 MAG: hypothetical protein BroJett018_48260 [Chloroflexota bacterium]
MGMIRRMTAAILLPFLWVWIAFVAWVNEDSVPDSLLFMLYLMGFFAAAQLLALVPNWIIYRGAVNRRVMDVSAKNRPVTGLPLRLHTLLLQMGFQRLGETDTAIPGRRETVSWVYINADGTINAELVAVMGAAVQFNTVFADHAVLETSYPFGENLAAENYRSVRVSSGLVNALQRHIEIGREMILEHGQPIPIRDMPTYLAWDVRYRQLYTQSGKLGASFRRTVHSVMLGAYAVGWLLLGWLMIEVQGEATLEALLLMGILSLVPLGWMIVQRR